MSGKNLFNSVQVSRPNKNVFDLSHDVKLSMNMGQLIPVMCTEVVPGDKFYISSQSMFRMAPMVAPIMHRIDSTIHYFFVPNRILWEGWEDFITNTPDPVTGNLPAFPTVEITAGASTIGSLPDYLGLPLYSQNSGTNSEVVSALPFAAYQKIWWEYYRDQNLMDAAWAGADYSGAFLVDGINPLSDLVTLWNRCWEHDYFTAALPFAQKSAPVSIPLGRVELDPDWASNGNQPLFENALGNANTGNLVSDPFGNNNIEVVGAVGQDVAYNPDDSLIVAPTTINDLRRAFRLQEWLEKAARGGSRYTEMIRTMFGVISSDARLQRPEYITGVKSPIQISEVLNTTGTVETPQGNMAGHGIGVINGKHGSFYAEEHGYIMGIMSVMPKTAYQQGIPKHFLKTSDPFQYYWEQFAHIGEQEVAIKEVYAFQAPGLGNSAFGYVPRYSEYKFEQNRVAGDMRTTLNHWHMGRIFTTLPTLSGEFVEARPTHRIFAVTDEEEQKLYVHHYNQVRAVRPMPKYGTPTY